MHTPNHAMTVANDRTLSEIIQSAQRRLIVVAPGVSLTIADVIAQRWRALDPKTVSITLDIDPEVCRLGYGEFEGLKLLSDTALYLNTTLNQHLGIRIGLIIADNETIIYTPTPLNVEAGPDTGSGLTEPTPNAIRVGQPPAQLEREVGAGPNGKDDQLVGARAAERETIKAVEEDLKQRPPQRFDISRRLRVFSAHIEFVELRLLGCNLSRRTINIPQDLFGVADEKTRYIIESKCRIIGEDDAGVWGSELIRIKNFIVKRFLVHLPSFGYVVRLSDKRKFELAVQTLEKMLDRARRRKRLQLQAAIDRRLEDLEKILLPLVNANPPERWHVDMFTQDYSRFLHKELSGLAGSSAELVENSSVELRYKGVTYDTLKDSKFVETVQAAMPDMKVLHHESDAAPSRNI